MKRELLNKWLEALRSDKYKQTTGILRDHCDEKDSFCCLGVLCEVAGLEYDPEVGYIDIDSEFYEDSEDAELPTRFAKKVGMKPTGDILLQVIYVPDGVKDLYEMNDDLRYDFKKIADIIEKDPLLFIKSIED